jgi:dTMP kinase
VDSGWDQEGLGEPDHHVELSVASGRLIVLEGAEAAGKSTQLRRLSSSLSTRGIPNDSWPEPGGTPLGREVREMLLDRSRSISSPAEALLFMAARAELVTCLVRPALEQGRTVLLDRFFLSTYAYQVHGRGLPEDAVRAANALATGGLVPDLTLVLAVDSGERAGRVERRGGTDRLESAGDAFHRRVAKAFDSFVAPEWQVTHPECGPIERIDGAGDEETVAGRIADALSRRWPETFSFPLGTHR